MRFPTELVEAGARFDEFVEDEHERLFKALYFVTASREDAEDLSQEAFLRVGDRWDQIDRVDDPTGYLFRVALNGFRLPGAGRRWRSGGSHRSECSLMGDRSLLLRSLMLCLYLVARRDW